VYYVDHWEFTQSRHTYVAASSHPPLQFKEKGYAWLSKSNTGFVAFDAYKSLLEDADGKISGPRTVIAGFGAGITESLLAVTPFESIKTQLYEWHWQRSPVHTNY
jgi:hypothetical protein